MISSTVRRKFLMYTGRKKLGFFVVIAFMLLALSGCSLFSAFDSLEINGNVDFFGEKNQYRVSTSKGSVEVARYGNAALFFDGDKGGISFYDAGGAKLWNSLPSTQTDSAADFYVKVFFDNKIYTLDTAANSFANNGVSYELGESCINVEYKLTCDGISVTLPVKYSLSGTFYKVEIDMSKCVCSDGAEIISVSVLPFMGALSYSETSDFEHFGDYFLLPDGPGALMYTAVENENFKSAVFSVYDKEYYEETVPAYAAAYGIKSLDNTLSATVTEGADNALIRVMSSNYDGDATNRVYPEFIITPLSGESGNVKAGEPYNGKIEVCYEAISGANADYMTMAVSVRQALISSGTIKYDAVEKEYPLFISVINSIDGESVSTSFRQSENLIELLKGKGVNNAFLILQGIFSGGISQKSNSSLKVLSSVGGTKDLTALCEYAASQQINVFVGTDFSSSTTRINAQKDLTGEKITAQPHSSSNVSRLYYKDFSLLPKASSALIDIIEKTGLDGVCIADSEKSAFVESGKTSGDYSSYSRIFNSCMSSVGLDSDIMTDGGNMNIVKNADYIRNISLDTAIEESNNYKAVPFIPAVLHSSYIYTGTPVNDAPISRLRLLKYVEYGATIHYEWCFDTSSDKYYDNTISEAVEFYNGFLSDLGDLSSKRIVGHSMCEDGVYCTEYDGGTKVYVNYNNYSVLLGDITVMPYDYLRVG